MGPESDDVPARLDSLTALRFPAALVVFAVHATVVHQSGVVHRLFGQGSVGVSFFFLLSGFVLAWSQRPGASSRRFYRRRFARIWPSHAVTWAAAGLVGVVGATSVSAAGGALSFGLLQAWVPRQGIYYAMNRPSWSLSCEAFFYLLFPLLIVPISRARTSHRWALVGAASAWIVVAAVLVAPLGPHSLSFWFIYVFPPMRLLEFVIGMALAVEVRRGWRPPVSLPVAFLVAIGGYVAAGWVPFGLSLVATTLVPFALLIAAAAGADADRRVSRPGLVPLIVLGVWSYAFYVVHWFVLAGIGHVVALGGAGVTVAALATSLAAAALLHRLVERPAERRLRGPAEEPRAPVVGIEGIDGIALAG